MPINIIPFRCPRLNSDNGTKEAIVEFFDFGMNSEPKRIICDNYFRSGHVGKCRVMSEDYCICREWKKL